ncbi:unnamed protein product [Cunninghamella echinulata]
MSIYDNLPALNSWYCHEEEESTKTSMPCYSPIVIKKKCSHNRNVSFTTEPPEIHYLSNYTPSITDHVESKMKSRLKRYASKFSPRST